MSAKADIKARGELDEKAHTCRPGRGNRSSQSSLASIEFRLGVGCTASKRWVMVCVVDGKRVRQ